MAKYAVLIGINTYRQAPLRQCVKDQQRIKAMLEPRGFECVCIFDHEATRAKCYDTISELAKKCVAGDELWVSFSGHGSYRISQDDHEKYDSTLCFYDKDGVDNDVVEHLESTSSNGVFTTFMFDCCHAGGLSRGEMIGDATVRFLPPVEENDIVRVSHRAAPTESRVPAECSILKACKQDQKAYEYSDGGAFTTEVCKVAEANKSISIRDLIDTVSDNVHERTRGRQTPKLGMRSAYNHATFLSNPLQADKPTPPTDTDKPERRKLIIGLLKQILEAVQSGDV